MTIEEIFKVMPLYFIAILTPPELTESVREIQREIARDFDSRHQLKVPVHLTLIPPFKIAADNLEELTKSLSNFSEKQQSIKVHFQGYGAFGKKVVFINLEENKRLNQLQAELTSWLKAKSPLDPPVYFEKFTPHITVANRDLSVTAFDKAWSVFENRKLDASFFVSTITLLRHDGKCWKTESTFPFQK